MIERLVYFICLAVDLEMIIMALFVLVESIKTERFRRNNMLVDNPFSSYTSYLLAVIFLAAAYPLFNWSICNYIGR